MLKAAFILLRVITAIAAFGALAATSIYILVTGAFALLSGGAHAIWHVTKLFASGFRDTSPTPQPRPLITLPLAGLVILFATMFTSVFTPSQRIFLHILAGMAAVAGIWVAWTLQTEPGDKIYYLPVIALWFVYYAVCLRRMVVPS